MEKKLAQKPSALSDFESLAKVAQTFLDTTDYSNLVQEVVDSVLNEIAKLGHDFHIAVLALKNEDANTLERISMSRTKSATDIRMSSLTQFEDIRTPLNAKDNYCIKAMNQKKHYLTHTFIDILHPPFSIDECTVLQEAGKIKTSVVFPIILKGRAIGIIIFSTKQSIESLSKREVTFIESLANIIGIAVENSELFKELEKEKVALEKVNKKLKILDRTKDEFLSVASHELRTPMTIIKSYLWMLIEKKGGDLNEKQKAYVQKAMGGTERLIALVNDMLNISRIEEGRVDLDIEEIDLKAFLKEVCEECRLKTDEKGLSLNLSTQNNLRTVYADSNKLSEILLNLGGNAIKYTDTGGIEAKAENIENGEFVKISITDTGKGISEEDMGRLFRKFSRLDNSFRTVAENGGTGLGLYITKSLVEMMGGKIGAESEGEGKGSTFWFTLPTKKIVEDIHNAPEEPQSSSALLQKSEPSDKELLGVNTIQSSTVGESVNSIA